MEIDTADSSIKKTYIYANSQIIAQHDGDHTANRYFYQHDRLGNVRQIIKPGVTQGNLANHYTYDPFGQLFATEFAETVSNSFRFTGQYYDSEIDQYYLRARQYDPHLYRFTGRDLIDGKFEEPLTLHKYLYCLNDPVNKIDPTGKWLVETHREFGDLGWGHDDNRGMATFDYGLLDKVKSPWDAKYRWMHFRSRDAIYAELGSAAGRGITSEFQELMHEWQDTYVHWDRRYRKEWGHISDPDTDKPTDPRNIKEYTYERCDITTKVWEQIWLRYNLSLDINGEVSEPSIFNISGAWLSFSPEASRWMIDF